MHIDRYRARISMFDRRTIPFGYIPKRIELGFGVTLMSPTDIQ